jgi:Na+-translocating ferredoxin:NAD+ oxidoreductase subunit B
MASGEALSNRCPPGGQSGAKALAAVLKQAELPLDLSRGLAGVPWRMKIDESNCIGCTKCIRACPVDAIIGANKRMHTIIPERCTGCELCIPPCPTDCITFVPNPDLTWTQDNAASALRRYHARQQRLTLEGAQAPGTEIPSAEIPAPLAQALFETIAERPSTETSNRLSAIQKALEHARLRLDSNSVRPTTLRPHDHAKP